MEAAVQKSVHWLHGAVKAADELAVGTGHGPVNHFYKLW